MHKYLVEITETLQRQFDVEAQSKEEAEKIASGTVFVISEEYEA